jgi:dihydropteroate synthase
MEHIVFLTGHLAQPALQRVLAGMDAPFTWEVRDIGLQVAGLMTADMVRRRVAVPVLSPAEGEEPRRADRLLLPGRCRGDVHALEAHFGIPVQRGPEELKDLPAFFNRQSKPVDLSSYRVAIFAEIVDAPRLDVAGIVARARAYAADGADVIDLGGLPATPFPHLEDSVKALKAEGFKVSVDSLDTAELLRGGRAGADYLLSLNLDTLWVADEVASTPVLIPRTPQDEESLAQAIETLRGRGRAFLADSILDPLPFGFTRSICRYQRLRDRFPDVDILVGVGNVTELTEADTAGMNALLLGMCEELQARAILTTQVSTHARRAVREADVARRLMHAAHESRSLAKGFTDELLTVHAKRPFPDTPEEIRQTAAGVRDPNFRVQVAEDGIHVYNRDGHHVGRTAMELYPALDVAEDGAHAFYLGAELMKAQTAFELGKRYVQDEELGWGVAVPRAAPDPLTRPAPGATLQERRERAREPRDS